MPMTLFTGEALTIGDDAKRRAEEAVELAKGEGLIELVVRTETGREFSVGAEFSALLGEVLARVAGGGTVTIRTAAEWLTTSAAAGMLGVSRTTVMKRIKAGELPSYMVGAHHRVRREDLLEFRRRRESVKRKAVKELLLLDESSD